MSYVIVLVARCTCDQPNCGKSFTARDDQPPTRCPYCGSKKWDVHGQHFPQRNTSLKMLHSPKTTVTGRQQRSDSGNSGEGMGVEKLQEKREPYSVPQDKPQDQGPSSSGRKPDFHSGNAGSIPAGPTKQRKPITEVKPDFVIDRSESQE